MGKHRTEKLSKQVAIQNNKTGQAAQTPKTGSNSHNQYR